jgi:hypothetical protein
MTTTSLAGCSLEETMRIGVMFLDAAFLFIP